MSVTQPTRIPRPLPADSARRLGAAVSALLAADAALHAFWATGVTWWPASDRRGLSYALLNADVPFTPTVLLPLCALLTTGAAGVWGHARGLGGRATRLTTAAVAAGLTVRALVGVVWATGIGSRVDTPFYWLNLLVYTPLCLTFGWAATRLASARSAGRTTAG